MTQAALVTGSAHRLGREFALGLAAKGYDIGLHYHSSRDAAEKTAEEIRSHGVDCEAFSFDLGSKEDPRSLVKNAVTRFPNLSVLVNSASVYDQAPVSETSIELFDRQMAVNLRAPLMLSKAFNEFVESGNIINIIDNKIHYNQFAYAAYLLSKKSLADLTKMSALEFSPRIRVNGIAPGVVLPAKKRSEEYIQWRVEGIPLKKQGEPLDLIKALSFILDNDFLTGQIISVDGGEGIDFTGQHAANYTETKQS